MRFGPVPVREAAGAISAHSIRQGEVTVRKGAGITAEQAAALDRAGIREVIAARLDPGDIGEDEAAHRVALALAGAEVRVEPPFTGRSNLFAVRPGILLIRRDLVDAVNAVHESVTLATLPAFKPVAEGEMVGTVKIIPYGVPGGVADRAVAAAGTEPAVSVASYRIGRVAALSTLLPGLKAATVTKTIAALRARLAPAGADVTAEATCPHDAEALTAELRRQAAGEAELIVVFGASAIADRRDVIPAAIEAAGGAVEHFGMPVDPGNLLLVGRVGEKPVIGAPGCARSPKENGFDWVLQRLLAGLAVTRSDITRLGVGGLLMEIVSRGQPRSGGEPAGEDEGE